MIRKRLWFRNVMVARLRRCPLIRLVPLHMWSWKVIVGPWNLVLRVLLWRVTYRARVTIVRRRRDPALMGVGTRSPLRLNLRYRLFMRLVSRGTLILLSRSRRTWSKVRTTLLNTARVCRWDRFARRRLYVDGRRPTIITLVRRIARLLCTVKLVLRLNVR